MPIQVLDAQGNVKQTFNAEINPNALRDAQMMAQLMNPPGRVVGQPYNGGGEMGGMMPPGGPPMGGEMGGMMPPGGPPPGILQRMGENRAMRREGRGAPPGGGQLNGGSPTIPGGPGENVGGEVPPELMMPPDQGPSAPPPPRTNHLESIRMMMDEEAREVVQGHPLQQQLAAMPPMSPPTVAPPQVQGMQGPQGIPGMPPGRPPGMPPGMLPGMPPGRPQIG